ncbi:Lin1244/Lin1753 domain-containing protein [Tissierella pigra]|uniref:DUF4373 domain-containing protein n=1 Tax=Tissierella pigra TaxID=2607614 RepID=A0A6N7XJY2_9FIRM|nr:Lin1244/Lin1753 domain-containing protein [Tissierella pigra]MSU01886.1 DUF4373 domain-containing protein [Tissierella pigra]
MARPKKETVDYFPHFVSSGKTLFILEQSYGNDGYAFWFKLLELLGNTDGHYYDCSNVPAWKFLLAKTRVEEEKAIEILNMLAELEAIDRDLWEEKIIWSDNFVNNLSPVYSNRKSDLPEKPVIASSNDSTDEFLPVETEDSSITTEITPQSKVKESKVKESKVKEHDVDLQIKNLRLRYSESQIKIIDEYFDILRWTRKNGKIADSVIVKIYTEWEKFKPDTVIYGLNVYINNPKYHDKRENYCYGIMRNAKDEEVYKGVKGSGANKGNSKGTSKDSGGASEESLRLEKLAKESGLIGEDGSVEPIGEIDF